MNIDLRNNDLERLPDSVFDSAITGKDSIQRCVDSSDDTAVNICLENNPGGNGDYCSVADNHCIKPTCDACFCSPGWTGATCNSTCSSGTYGYLCSKTCNCTGISMCDPVTGECRALYTSVNRTTTEIWPEEIHISFDLQCGGKPPGACTYKLFRYIEDGSNNRRRRALTNETFVAVLTRDRPSVIDAPLIQKTNYTYAIVTNDTGVPVSYFNSFVTPAVTVPAAPTNLRALTGLDTFHLGVAWNAVPNKWGKILFYTVYKNSKMAAVLDDETSTRTYMDTVAVLSTIAYQVSANTSAGEGPLTSPLSLTVSAAVPQTSGGGGGNVGGTVAGAVVGVLGFVVGAVLFAVYMRRRRQDNTLRKEQNEMIVLMENAMHNPKLADIEVDPTHLTLLERIGEGEFGSVHKGSLQSDEIGGATTPVAVKTLKLDKALSPEDTQAISSAFFGEIELMNSVPKHQNVVSLLGVVTKVEPRRIVLEFAEFGDLKSYVHKWGETMPPAQLVNMGADVARGMAHLSSMGIVHRDLAARNCLVSRKGASGLIVKVGDFGLSRHMEGSDYYRVRSNTKLPIKWMAPESISHRTFTSATDCWSFGVTLWEVFSQGAKPYSSMNNQDISKYLKAGNRLSVPDNCPAQVYDLMMMCWRKMPETRPSFTVLCERLEAISATFGSTFDKTNDNSPASLAKKSIRYQTVKGQKYAVGGGGVQSGAASQAVTAYADVPRPVSVSVPTPTVTVNDVSGLATHGALTPNAVQGRPISGYVVLASDTAPAPVRPVSYRELEAAEPYHELERTEEIDLMMEPGEGNV
eukprot:Opistho-2@25000